MPRYIYPIDKLPVPDINGKHKVRFRLRTEDGNAISAWSNFFVLDSIGQTASAPYRYSATVDNSPTPKLLRVAWSIDD
ncbi:MAG: hypothetical protein ACO295_00450 [Sediminibacterium sp.]